MTLYIMEYINPGNDEYGASISTNKQVLINFRKELIEQTNQKVIDMPIRKAGVHTISISGDFEIL